MTLRLYLAQRISALIMAPLVLGHVAVMIVAIQGGLSAEEILSRTQGSVFWAAFYGLFVLAVAVHGAIGIRTVLFETLKIRGTLLDTTALVIFATLLATGLRAVYAVTVGP